MVIRMQALAAASALALGLALTPTAAAQAIASRDASPATIETMRARDRFANPQAELAAWRGFADRVFADPEATPALRAETHARLAVALFYANAYAEAWTQIEDAERLIEAHQLHGERFAPEALAYGSLISRDVGEMGRAQSYGDRALALALERFGEDSAEAGLAYNSLAYLAFARGDMPAARDLMCRAAERARRHLPPSDAMVSNNMISCAIALYYLDDPGTADAIRAASAFAHAHLPRDHPKLTLALNSSSGILVALGRYAEAEQILRTEVDRIRSHYGENYPDLYSTLSVFARVLDLQGKSEEAEAVYRSAIDLAHRLHHGNEPTVRGQSLLNLGELYRRNGRIDEAIALYRQGYDELRRDLEPGHVDIGAAEVSFAMLLARDGQLDEAIRLAQMGRANLAAALPEQHRDRLKAEIGYAAILARTGDVAGAFAIARPAADIMEARLLDLALSRSELVSLSPLMVGGFREFARIALLAGESEQAVRAAQMASLSELNLVNAELAARHAAQEGGVADLLESLRARRVEVGRLRGALVEAQAEGGDVADLSRRIDEGETEIARITDAVETRFPGYRALGRPQPAALAEIQARLSADQALVIPLALEGRMLTILVTSDSVLHSETDGDAAGLVQRLRRSMDGFELAADPRRAPFDADAAHQLYRLVLPPDLEQALASRRELLFPASGPLASLSPALLLRRPLPDGASLSAGDWLIRSHAVAIVSAFGAAGRSEGTSRQLGFAGIGGPALAPSQGAPIQYASLFRGGTVDPAALRSMPNLPGAQAELTRMSEAFGQGRSMVLTGPQATEAAFKRLDLEAYSVVAIATHGLTSGEMQGLSEPALVFTPPDEARDDDDGLLTASEIARLSIPADWVILSACNSGSGRNASAPVYSGLARAFRLAGARSLLLSHWRVRDDAAARLTVDTVRGAAEGIGRAEALRQAMLNLMRDEDVPGAPHPALWAPFILIGD